MRTDENAPFVWKSGPATGTTLCDWIPLNSLTARALEALGYGAFDALHLACAEEAAVDVLLTTHDRFINQAGRRLGKPMIRVLNPVD